MILTDSGKKYKIEFEELERKVFDMCMSEGRAIMSEIMSELDEQLFKNCDKKLYKSEGRRKTNLKTLMGAVDYRRASFLENCKILLYTDGIKYLTFRTIYIYQPNPAGRRNTQ